MESAKAVGNAVIIGSDFIPDRGVANVTEIYGSPEN